MLLAQVVKLTCKLASVLLLARLVSPNDHGLFAMASTVVLLLTLFRDAGLGAAAVQTAVLAPVQLSTLFWTHLGIGILLTALSAGAAPLAAEFYSAPAVLPLLLLMSTSFLLIGAGGFVRSQLERAARFNDVARIEATAAIAGTIAMVAAAVGQAGAYAFAVYLLVSEALATALAWHAIKWRPASRPRWSSIHHLLRTGRDVTGYQLIGYLLQQVDAIVVGHFFGAYLLGLYNRASQLLALPLLYLAGPVNQVALVSLSRAGTASPAFAHHARTTATVVAHLVLPVFAVCAILPEEIVRLVLGPQWPEAAPFLRVLSFAAAAATLTSFAYALNVAAGQTRRLLWSAAAALPLTILAVWVGARSGPLGVAQGIAAVNMLLLGPRWWWAMRELPGSFAGYLNALLGPGVSTAAAALGFWLGRESAAGADWAVRLSAGVAGGGIGLVLAASVWPRLRSEWRIVFAHLPIPRPNKFTSGA